MKRYKEIDFMKGMLICLVILGHIIQAGQGEAYLNESKFYLNYFFKIIYSFHLPLFAMVSGLLGGLTYKSMTVFKYMKGKVKRLIIPIFIYGIIYTVLRICFDNCLENSMTPLSVISFYFNTCLYSWWFLWGIFLFSIICFCNKKYFNNTLVTYILIFLLSFITPDIFNFHIIKFIYPYYVIGFLASERENSLNEKKIKYSGADLLIAIIFVIMLFKYKTEYYIYESRYSIWGKQYLHQIFIDIYRFIIGFLGCEIFGKLILKGYKVVSKCKISDFICWCGRQSLDIYIIHGLLITYILIPISVNNTLSVMGTLIELLIILGSTSVIITIKNKIFHVFRR